MNPLNGQKNMKSHRNLLLMEELDDAGGGQLLMNRNDPTTANGSRGMENQSASDGIVAPLQTDPIPRRIKDRTHLHQRSHASHLQSKSSNLAATQKHNNTAKSLHASGNSKGIIRHPPPLPYDQEHSISFKSFPSYLTQNSIIFSHYSLFLAYYRKMTFHSHIQFSADVSGSVDDVTEMEKDCFIMRPDGTLQRKRKLSKQSLATPSHNIELRKVHFQRRYLNAASSSVASHSFLTNNNNNNNMSTKSGLNRSRKNSFLSSTLHLFSHLPLLSKKKRKSFIYGIRIKQSHIDTRTINLNNDEELVEVLLKWRHLDCVLELFRFLVMQSKLENVYTLQMEHQVGNFSRRSQKSRNKRRKELLHAASMHFTHASELSHVKDKKQRPPVHRYDEDDLHASSKSSILSRMSNSFRHKNSFQSLRNLLPSKSTRASSNNTTPPHIRSNNKLSKRKKIQLPHQKVPLHHASLSNVKFATPRKRGALPNGTKIHHTSSEFSSGTTSQENRHIRNRLESHKTTREIAFSFLKVICSQIHNDNIGEFTSFLNHTFGIIKQELISDQMERYSPIYKHSSQHSTISSASTMRGYSEKHAENEALRKYNTKSTSSIAQNNRSGNASTRKSYQHTDSNLVKAVFHGADLDFEEAKADFLSHFQSNPYDEILIQDKKQQKINFNRLLFHCTHSSMLFDRICELFNYKLNISFRNPFQQLKTCLHAAAMQFNPTVIRHLLDIGVDPNITDIDGNSPWMSMFLHYSDHLAALDRGDEEMFHSLHLPEYIEEFSDVSDRDYFTDDEQDKRMLRIYSHHDRLFHLLKQCLLVFLSRSDIDTDMVNQKGHSLRDLIRRRSRNLVNLHTTMEKNGELFEILYLYELERKNVHDGSMESSSSVPSRARRSHSCSSLDNLSKHDYAVHMSDVFSHPPTMHRDSTQLLSYKSRHSQLCQLQKMASLQNEEIDKLKQELQVQAEIHNTRLVQVSRDMTNLLRTVERIPHETMHFKQQERKSLLIQSELEEYSLRKFAKENSLGNDSYNSMGYNPLDFIIQDPRGDIREFLSWKHILHEWSLQNVNGYSLLFSLDNLLALHAFNIRSGDAPTAMTSASSSSHLPTIVREKNLFPFGYMMYTPFTSSVTQSPNLLRNDASFFEIMQFFKKRPILPHVSDPETYFFTKTMRSVYAFYEHVEDYERELHRNIPLMDYIAALSSNVYGVSVDQAVAGTAGVSFPKTRTRRKKRTLMVRKQALQGVTFKEDRTLLEQVLPKNGDA